MWAPQMPDLLDHFHLLRYDTRGHGASDVPDGDYTIDQLGNDVIGLMDALRISQAAFCGLSMGGAIGQWIALQAAQRLSALVLANTAPKFSTPDVWDARRQAVLEGGMAAVVDAVMQRFFSVENQASRFAWSTRVVLLGTDPRGYAFCCAALRDSDFRAGLAAIRIPTLVIGSDRDPSTPWDAHGAVLAKEIPGAKALRLNTAHLSNLEQPRSFTSALLNFLLPELRPEDAYEAGLNVRREVLGAEHVERALAQATELNRDFQELITRYAWGGVWMRPGLDHRTRRLLVLAIAASLGRWEEFRLHLRAAMTHGLEAGDVTETLLQVAIYAGVPAANTAFRIAKEEMEKPAGGG